VGHCIVYKEIKLNMLQIISKTPSYYLFRKFGWPKKLPMNLTLSISYNCNSRCKTCNIYKKKTNDLSLEEWQKIFSQFGTDLFWATFSGGEPFLRNDLEEIACSLYETCSPAIINIPTNGLLKNQIPQTVRNIADHCKKAQIVINVSIDDIEERHDKIRGVQGSYEKAVDTFSDLKSINLPNLSIGIHTVISKYNVKRIPHIYRELSALKPDSYITEIAEERVELDTIDSNISPRPEDYAVAVNYLIDQLKKEEFSQVGKIARSFRIEYYRLVQKILKEKRQVIPCYTSIASAQIAPDGNVWMCCIKADSIGNLRDVAYDFNRLWTSEKASALRRSIKTGECYCPLANAGYTNILHNLSSVRKVSMNFIKNR